MSDTTIFGVTVGTPLNPDALDLPESGVTAEQVTKAIENYLATKKFVTETTLSGALTGVGTSFTNEIERLENSVAEKYLPNDEPDTVAQIFNDFIAQYGFEFTSFEELIVVVNEDRERINTIETSLGDINSVLTAVNSKLSTLFNIGG